LNDEEDWVDDDDDDDDDGASSALAAVGAGGEGVLDSRRSDGSSALPVASPPMIVTMICTWRRWKRIGRNHMRSFQCGRIRWQHFFAGQLHHFLLLQ